MKENNPVTIETVIKKVESYIKDKNEIEVIKKSYQYAKEKHAGQKRLDSNDYIEHPLNVALILTDLNVDHYTLAASLLHDVIINCDDTIENIKVEFGEEIGNLVDSCGSTLLCCSAHC
jgi:GTP pyrophosphokinase